jgi:hypothetical protein
MSRKKETYNKREKEKQKIKRQNDKAERKEQRKVNNDKGKPLEEMLAYLDENGNLTSVPPPPNG